MVCVCADANTRSTQRRICDESLKFNQRLLLRSPVWVAAVFRTFSAVPGIKLNFVVLQLCVINFNVFRSARNWLINFIGFREDGQNEQQFNQQLVAETDQQINAQKLYSLAKFRS